MTSDKAHDDPFATLKQFHDDYKAFDSRHKNLGRVDELFVDTEDRTRYIGIRTGLLNMNFILIPVELVRVNDKRQVVEAADSKEKIERAPAFKDAGEITPKIEDRIRSYFGLEPLLSRPDDSKRPDAAGGSIEYDRIDLVPGERKESPREPGSGSYPLPGDSLTAPGQEQSIPGWDEYSYEGSGESPRSDPPRLHRLRR